MNLTWAMGYQLGTGVALAINEYLVREDNQERIERHSVVWTGSYLRYLVLNPKWEMIQDEPIKRTVQHFIASVLVASSALAERYGRKVIKVSDVEFILFTRGLF